MGEFLSVSGVIQATTSQVADALKSFCEANGGVFAPATADTDDDEILGIARGAGGVSVLYPTDFFDWDDASQYISRFLHRPVFSFHIHDGDLWMFVLYVEGQDVARFNPIPDYWDENISQQQKESLRGDAHEIAKHVPGLKPESIEKYFQFWNLDDESPAKAYPEDEHTYLDCWQMVDFIQKVGLPYASEDSDVPSAAYEFRTRR